MKSDKILYKKFQFGWVIVIIFTVLIVSMTFAYIYNWGSNPIDTGGYIFMMLIMSAIYLGFYGMTVIVTDKYIKIKFGIGLFTKKVYLYYISSVDIVECPVCFGYGIRIIPGGMLYNVSGKYSVRIHFRDKKNILQIGTKDPETLKKIIEDNILAV